MAGVHVVTDSACDLTDELAAAANVTVVPLTIRFGTEEFLDRRDLSAAEFWQRCKGASTLPETAAPSPGAFAQAFEDAAAGGADGILCLSLSSGVSATYQAALAGAESVSRDVPIQVIDTRSLTMGQGLMCLSAANASRGGASLEELVELVKSLIPRTRVFGVLASLDHLQRGGRIGGAAALVGSLLSIKPVVQVKDGVVAEESKQRTRARSLEYLCTKIAGDAPLERLAICNGSADDVDVVVKRLSEVEVTYETVVVDLGPVVGTHTGPGTIGVCYQLPASS